MKPAGNKLKIKIKFFAAHREFAGLSELDLEIEDDSTISDLMETLYKKFPELKQIEEETIVSVNKVYVEVGKKLEAGDEVAIFPPVSGG